jgi:lactoylglutathione lyase
MPDASFPVIYATSVSRSVEFYRRLGFESIYQFPPDGEPGYVGLARGETRLGVTTTAIPMDMFGQEVGSGPRFELFTYVEDVDVTIEILRAAGHQVLREAADMPWGERIAYVADPDGNPVTLAAPTA